jgi:hypothetical protein
MMKRVQVISLHEQKLSLNILHAMKELFVVIWMGAKDHHTGP